MHMNPNQLDDDGILSGKQVKAGETIGKVGNYNKRERGTTYHLHFDLQVPTRVGYVFVNPYMTLVAAYERLIGERGTEIKPGDPVPPETVMAPVIERPAVLPPAAAALAKETTAVKVKPEPRKRRHIRKRYRHAARN
jgi:murein DD-endopeptidase MepM/ murein hydrolase activator NlpD